MLVNESPKMLSWKTWMLLLSSFCNIVEEDSAEPEPAPRVTESLSKDTLVCTPTMAEARYSRVRNDSTLKTNTLNAKPKLTIPMTTPFSRKRKERKDVEKQIEDTSRVEDVFSVSSKEEAAGDAVDNSNDQTVAENLVGKHGAETGRAELVGPVDHGMPPEKSSNKKRGRPRKCRHDENLMLEMSTISSTPALSSVAPTQKQSASHGARESKQPSASQNVSGLSHGVSDSGQFDAEHLGSKTPKKIVHFNDKGQPIGEGSAPFASYLGAITRKHLQVCYEKWRDVPDQSKDFIWKMVTDEYIVPVAYKAKILDKIHNYWRAYKSILRSKYYDTCDTDEERKRNCPTGIKQDVWELFVDNLSTPAAQARRKAGKFSRQSMNAVSTSGRTGAARLAETLKKGDPLATITRTDLFLALHTRKDGSCSTPEFARKVEQIKAIVEQNPNSVHLDVDHDPVAQVCGRERKGRYVRALGVGVTRASLLHSAPAIEQLQKERHLRVSEEERVADLKKQVVSQRQQIGQIQHEKKFRLAAEAQITDLREQINSQGLMIAEMKELITRLCS